MSGKKMHAKPLESGMIKKIEIQVKKVHVFYL